MSGPVDDLVDIVTTLPPGSAGAGYRKGTVASVGAHTAVVSVPGQSGPVSLTAPYLLPAPTVGSVVLLLLVNGSLIIVGKFA